MSLTIQRPSVARFPFDMNPSGHGQEGPFGYHFNYDEPVPDSSEPAPAGASLLNSHESGMLDDFLSQGMRYIENPDPNEGPKITGEFSWLMTELPPSLQTVTAAPIAPANIQNIQNIQQQTYQHGGIDFSQLGVGVGESSLSGAGHDENLPSQIPTHPVSYQTNLFPNQGNASGSETMYSASNIPSAISASSYLSPSTAEPSPQQVGDRSGPAYMFGRPLVNDQASPYKGEFQFDDSHELTHDPESVEQRLYRFGSDNQHFNQGHFIPANPADNFERFQRAVARDFAGIRPVRSTETSEPPTPIKPLMKKRARVSMDSGANMAAGETSDDNDDDEENHEPKPRKRRKGDKHRADESDSSSSGPSPNTHSRRASYNPRSSLQKSRKPSSLDTSTRRRKSSPPPSRPSRENLTEEQKRSNHILSEQKRRNLIKNGFDELNHLVPELRAGGFSKSNMLVEAANYLDVLVAGNAELREKMDMLRGGARASANQGGNLGLDNTSNLGLTGDLDDETAGH